MDPEAATDLATLLRALGITQSIATCVRKPLPKASKSDDWTLSAFHWSLVLIGPNGAEMGPIDFYTGSAHVSKLGPKRPSTADVIFSLVGDASASETTFADWCADMGTDTDSRKALETFLECQELGTQVRKFLNQAAPGKWSEIVRACSDF